MQNHPIPSVTDPLQYRAIGIVRGTYKPHDNENFTRGLIIDSNGLEIDSVVLGRVLTLIRKHVLIEKPHLWVVYPRCRDQQNLHLQIAGIWEPSSLNNDVKEIKEKVDESGDASKIIENVHDELEEGDDYFSIRGELIFTKPEEKEVVIKIRQRPRNQTKKDLPFKIKLKGDIPINYVRHFISLNVRRIQQHLLIEDFEIIEPMPSRSNEERKINKLNKKKNDK